MVILGDHQPRRPVADMDTDRWTVPVHVASRDRELLERFTRSGYGKGLETAELPLPAPGLSEMATHIFHALNDVTTEEVTVEIRNYG